MPITLRKSFTALSLAGLASVAAAGLQGIPGNTSGNHTKDIVLERVTSAPASPGAAPTAPMGDAMIVSVLVESPDGTLTPRSTESLFRTGERFRVKLLGSRDATVSIFNTNPRGDTGEEPVWRGTVKVGQETVTPRMALVGHSGVDLLHVVMEPAETPSVFAWLGQWLRSVKLGDSKDVRLDTQSTGQATYLVNAGGQGLVSTIGIAHKAP
jgi:hypothetical protein